MVYCSRVKSLFKAYLLSVAMQAHILNAIHQRLLKRLLGFWRGFMAFSAQERTDRWVKNLATNVNPHKKFAVGGVGGLYIQVWPS